MIFEGHKVEIFDFNGTVLFNPRHVGECLELTESAVRMSIAKMNEKQVIKLKNLDVKDTDIRKLNNAGENFLTESGVYKLIFKSKKEQAEKFQDWVTDEVLPAIRKTGTYQSKVLTPIEQLRLQNQALLQLDTRVEEVNKDLQEFKLDMPILGIEESRITAAVKRKGVNCLGGKDSEAYQDKSIRGKVYADIYGQLKREFGVTTYKAIKRCQCDCAIRVVENYELPLALKEQIEDANSQYAFVG